MRNVGGHLNKDVNADNIQINIIYEIVYYIDKLLNINLEPPDHFIHHKLEKYNYSAKFNILDKYFKTYKKYNS